MLFRNDKKDNRDATTNVVPLFPLRELIVFPHEVYPIFVGRQKSIKALEAAEAKKTPILLVTQKDAKVAEPAPRRHYTRSARSASSCSCLRLPDGTVKALVEGKKRARVIRYVADEEYFQVEAEEIEEVSERTTEVEALMRSVVSTFDNYVAAQQEDSARDGNLDRGGRRSRVPGRQAGRTSRDQARRQAGAARIDQPGRAAGEDPRLHALGARNPRGRKAHPLARQEADGEDARRSTTSTSRCARFRRSSARRTNSRTRSRSWKKNFGRRRCPPRPARSASARSRSSR